MGQFKAAIFDMDGVLIDSEHLWRKAMIMAFAENNMMITEDECRKTMGMRIGEVIEQWLFQFKLSQALALPLENRIITLLLELIEKSGKAIDGIPELISFCKENKLLIGIATSSSNTLMNAVMDKLVIRDKIDAAVSAEFLPYAKPHPEVFLNCSKALNVNPEECIVIEDSLNGIIAAKAARMTVIAVPEDAHLKADELRAKQFILADHRMNNMLEVLAFFKMMFARI